MHINRVETLNEINCKSFFHNLKTLCEEHVYSPSNIWNANETSVQARRIDNVKVLSRHESHNVYGMIPKAMELMIFLSTSMLLGNQSQILTFSKDEKRKGTIVKNVNLHHNGHA